MFYYIRTMKLIIRGSIVLLVLLSGCKNNHQRRPFQGKEFEGIITYRLTYSEISQNRRSGDTLKVIYSKGNLIKQYNWNNSEATRKEIFLVDGNRFYTLLGRNDTLYSADISNHHSTRLIRSTHSISDTRILGYDCEQIDQYFESGVEDFKTHIELLYSNAALKMNTEYFKGR